MQKRSKFMENFYRFVQRVHKAEEKTKVQSLSVKEDIKLIIEHLYNFLSEYGFVFFFNIFVPLPRTPQTQLPIIAKIMEMTQKLLQSSPDALQKKNQFLCSICCLIQSYCKEIQYFLKETRSVSMIINSSKDKKDQKDQKIPIKYYLVKDLVEAIDNLKEMMMKSQFQPKNINQIHDPQRSVRLIALSKTFEQPLKKKDTLYISGASKKQNFRLCAAQICKLEPKNIFEERMFNHYKKIIQSLVSKGQKNLDHCCSIFVRKQEEYLKLQSKFHEHKNYHWPIEMPSIVKHVKKTIVGFLNLQGGIIYIGTKENPNTVQSVGIYLTNEEVIKFFQWIHELCQSIFPLLSEDKNGESEKLYKQDLEKLKNRSKLQDKSQYIVNKCIAVEFLSVIDKQTYEDCYQEEKTDLVFKKLYLIRIKIKAGSKFDTFHLLKDEKQGQIECFMRKDSSVNKQNLEEFFKLYTERLMDYLNQEIDVNDVENECPKAHFNF